VHNSLKSPTYMHMSNE